jgi:hypothetical protein
MLPDIDIDDLPVQAREIADVVGLGAATALVARYGGVRLYVPETLTAEHPLVQLIGMDAAERLARHYGRERIEVPRCVDAVRRARNRALVRDAEHMSQPELARKYQITERAVRLIWRDAGIAPDDRQAALF